MGDNSNNSELAVHFQGGVFLEVRFRHHHGQQGIDTTQVATPSQFASMRSAALQSQAAFETAAAIVLGPGWWSARPQEVRDDFYRFTLATDPSAL